MEDKTLGIMTLAFEGSRGNGGNEDNGIGWFLLRRDAAPSPSGIMRNCGQRAQSSSVRARALFGRLQGNFYLCNDSPLRA